MISFTTEDGVPVTVEFVDDGNEVARLLQVCFSKKALQEINKTFRRSAEMIFSVTVGRREELPMVRYITFHLDSRHKQNYCAMFQVHKDQINAAKEVSRKFMSHVKNLNNWNETERVEMDLERNPNLARLCE
jgi:hypothetical protein